MTTTMEWRAAPRHPAFEVSEYGDVRRAGTTKRIKGFLDADGYVRFSLTESTGERRTVAAHQLVAETYIGPRPGDGYEVAHENGSRPFCHYSNLRWAVPVDNQADRRVHQTSPVGARNPRAKITESDVVEIRREYRRIKQPLSGRRVAELDQRFGLARATIIRIATGASWPHVPMPSFPEAS